MVRRTAGYWYRIGSKLCIARLLEQWNRAAACNDQVLGTQTRPAGPVVIPDALISITLGSRLRH